MRTPISVRLSELQERQLAELGESTGMNQSEIIKLAIDRMAREEIKMAQSTDYREIFGGYVTAEQWITAAREAQMGLADYLRGQFIAMMAAETNPTGNTDPDKENWEVIAQSVLNRIG
jgi:predicted transcriptional regulator